MYFLLVMSVVAFLCYRDVTKWHIKRKQIEKCIWSGCVKGNGNVCPRCEGKIVQMEFDGLEDRYDKVKSILRNSAEW